MTAPSQRLSPIGFWSYARQDDTASGGRLSQLRTLLASELQQLYGRDKVQLWQDVAAIPPGTEWEKAIDDAIAQSTFLIPIITPAFVESEYCCKEIAKFLAREAQINAAHPELRGQRRIFPIVYIDAEDSDPFDPETMACLSKLQFVDFRQLRIDDDPQQIRKALLQLAGQVAQLLKIKVASALSPEALAALEAERQEAARRAAERQAEARRQAEAAQAQREADEAARKAARAANQQQRDARIAMLRTALTSRRFVLTAVAGVAGVTALSLATAQSDTIDDADAYGAADPMVTEEPLAGEGDQPYDPAEALVGVWAFSHIPCEIAAYDNGAQELRRNGAGEWFINSVMVAGSSQPDAEGWFFIGGYYWRVEGEELQLTKQLGDELSLTRLKRCFA